MSAPDLSIPEGIGKWFLTREDELKGYLSLPRYEIPSRTVWGGSLPSNCKMCGQRMRCRLLREDFMELCTGAHPAPKGSIVVQGCVITFTRCELKPERMVKPKTEFIKSRALSLLRDDVYIPESALKVPGIDEPSAKWEEYSATPFIDAYSDIPFWEEPEEERNLRATQQGFDVVTRKQRAKRHEKAEEKRQDRFMLNHGFRLKDRLESLQIHNPVRARIVASKLTFHDWQAIDLAGGLRKP